jgi:hypothetical protein
MSNLITTGYGKPILIGESLRLLTKEEALQIEAECKELVGGTGEYCSPSQVDSIIQHLTRKCGYRFHASQNVEVGKSCSYAVGDTINASITSGVIQEATEICTNTSSTSHCVLAVALLKQGLARPDVQGGRTRFSLGGKRYTCVNSTEAYSTIMDFDSTIHGDAERKLTERVVTLQVIDVEDIKPRKYHTYRKRTQEEGAKPRRTRGRDKGLVRYFSKEIK